MAPSHAEVNDASVYIHGDDMQITKGDLIDVLRTLDDVQWIVNSGASFHVTPVKECFTTFYASNHGHVYLGNNYVCSIKGNTSQLVCMM